MELVSIQRSCHIPLRRSSGSSARSFQSSCGSTCSTSPTDIWWSHEFGLDFSCHWLWKFIIHSTIWPEDQCERKWKRWKRCSTLHVSQRQWSGLHKDGRGHYSTKIIQKTSVPRVGPKFIDTQQLFLTKNEVVLFHGDISFQYVHVKEQLPTLACNVIHKGRGHSLPPSVTSGTWHSDTMATCQKREGHWFYSWRSHSWFDQNNSMAVPGTTNST